MRRYVRVIADWVPIAIVAIDVAMMVMLGVYLYKGRAIVNNAIDVWFDRSDPTQRARLEEIMAKVNFSALNQNGPEGAMETCQSIESRTQGMRLVTDDNMGNEWQQFSIRTFVHGIASMFRNLWKHFDLCQLVPTRIF